MTPNDLTTWRKRLGLNKVQAAEALGVNRNTVADYEAGRYPIPLYIELACAWLDHVNRTHWS